MPPPVPIVDQESWCPRRFHSVEGAEIIWRQTDEGIEVKDEGVRRTKGEPTTLRRIVKDYGHLIDAACEYTDVPRQLVAGMIAAESRGIPTAEREEPPIKDWSIGLTQTLTATAFTLAAQAPEELNVKEVTKLKPLPQGGDLAEWRGLLRQPFYGIRLGALYFSIVNRQSELKFDPVLCYAAYNAGSVRENLKNPFGLHYYRKKLPDGRWADAMENFCRWFGDACAVYGECI